MAHPFDDRWNHNTAHYPRIAELVEGRHTVLDVGCGEGTLVRYLSSLGHEVVGIDSDNSVFPASSPELLLADARNIPFPARSFDAVVSVATLHHLGRPDAELALVEMRRVLKPGGRIVLLGLARNRGLGDLAQASVDIVRTRIRDMGRTGWEPDTIKADADLSWSEARELVSSVLEGASWTRVPGYRYLAVWDAD